MVFKQLFDKETCTYTYLLADDSNKAVLIDPVRECVQTYIALLDELGLTLHYALDTHVHADHITGAGELRKITGCQTGISVHADVDCADIALSEGMVLEVGKLNIRVLETPGHTPTCVSFLCHDMVFTGDALLIDGCGRTDFQGGDAGQLYDAITTKLFTLPEHTTVYPGHDYHGRTKSTIAEQKQNNPRLNQTRSDFIKLMKNLNLPEPKRIEEAVPANRACGQM
jgi:glyoxylase-like metal-dependent hydrolase (beta-lactamase superfamily II)